MNNFDYNLNTNLIFNSMNTNNSSSGGNEKNQLWKLMFELGFASCEPNTLRDLYSHLIYDNPGFVLRENDVAKALGMMMCNATMTGSTVASSSSNTINSNITNGSGTNQSIITVNPNNSNNVMTNNLTDSILSSSIDCNSNFWDIESFVMVIKEINPKIDWTIVVKDLDYADFYLKEPKGFEYLIRAYKKATNDFITFPIKYLFNPWKNLRGQLSLIRQAVLMPLDFFSFSMFPCRRIFTPEDLTSSIPTYKSLLMGIFQQNWNCLDLLEYLISLFDTEYHDVVRPILEIATRNSPELFCLGLASFPNWTGISLRDTLVKLVCGFVMGGHNNCAIILPKLWNINPSIVLACMVDLYRKDPSCLSRILDVAQDLKILNLILESKPGSFCLDIAALASRREHLNLEKWVTDSILNKKEIFVRPCLEFLRDRIKIMLERQEGKSSSLFIPLSSEILLTFTNSILALASELSNESVEICRELQNVIIGNISSGTNNSSNNNLSVHSSSSNLQSIQESRGAPVQQPEINFPVDVEEEVNSYYERIYRHEFEIKDIIELFSSLKTSKNPRDQQVFACMIHNLFDEYQYFHGYPDKELNLTAIIFGILIQYQLISYVPLGIALRCIMDALKKPPQSKLFKFGLQAILQCRSRLIEWPQYCSHLLQIPHLVQLQPEIATYLKQCLLSASHNFSPYNSSTASTTASNSSGVSSIGMSMMNSSAPSLISSSTVNSSNFNSATISSSSNSPTYSSLLLSNNTKKSMTENEALIITSATSGGITDGNSRSNFTAGSNAVKNNAVTSISTGGSSGSARQFVAVENAFSSININVLLEAIDSLKVESPDNSFQDKISFIINNLSLSNMIEKSSELIEIFSKSPQFYNWFCVYLVIKRASIEPNFHELYVNLLQEIQPHYKMIFNEILVKTLFSVNVLIKSEKTLSSSSDRTLLKNLGIWLGGITLARNRPILKKDLCLKQLLISGYESDKLIVVIPFVCKILDQSVKSSVFIPYNPWLMAILRLLCELYYLNDLKLTLKFEIELLYKHLKLDLSLVEPSCIFKNRSVKKRISSLTSEKRSSTSIGGLFDVNFVSMNSHHHDSNSSNNNNSPFSPRMPSTDDKNLGIPILASYVIFNSNFTVFQNNPFLCKLLLFAFDFGIREISVISIKRAISIASCTVSVLIGKDFDLKDFPLDKKITYAKNMLQNIVDNLINVTVKEHLKGIIFKLAEEYLALAELRDIISRQVLLMVIEENLDLCSAFIEKAALDKCSQEVEYLFKNDTETENGCGESFENRSNNFHSSLFQNNPDVMPDVLKFSTEEINSNLSKIYDDFVKTSRIQSLSTLPLQGPIPGISVADKENLANFLQSSPGLLVKKGKNLENSSATSSATATATATIKTSGLSSGLINESSTSLTGINSSLSIQQCMDKFSGIFLTMESMIGNYIQNGILEPQNIAANSEVKLFMRQILLLACNSLHKDEVCLLFLHKIVQYMYKSSVEQNKSYSVEVCVMLIEKLCEISTKSAKEVTTWFIYSEDERKFDVPVTVAVLLTGLISLFEYDSQLARLLDSSKIQPSVLKFCINLLQSCLLVGEGEVESEGSSIAGMKDQFSRYINDKTCAVAVLFPSLKNRPFLFSDFICTLEALESLLNESGSGSKGEKITQEHSKAIHHLLEQKSLFTQNDVKAQVAYFFADWMRICQFSFASSTSPDQRALCRTFISHLFSQSLSSSVENVEVFFKYTVQCAIETYAKQRRIPSSAVFSSLDALAKLICLLIDGFPSDYVLLKRHEMFGLILEYIALAMNDISCESIEVAGKIQSPFCRLLVFLLKEFHEMFEMNVVDASSFHPTDCKAFEIYSVVCQFLLEIQPLSFPSFVFGWFEVVSSKYFMPVALNFSGKVPSTDDKKFESKSQIFWDSYARLIEGMFQFLHLSAVKELSHSAVDSFATLYKGILRVLLVLLHDFPDFLSFYYVEFCDALPLKFVQFRNLILSAFPRSMKLPDPFTLNLKMDSLPDCSDVPCMSFNWKSSVTTVFQLIGDMKEDDCRSICDLLKQHVVSFRAKDSLKEFTDGINFSGELASSVSQSTLFLTRLHTLVLYCGHLTVENKRNVYMKLLHRLVVEFDPELRYCLLGVIVNQLRYPNVFTLIFSKLLLGLFDDESNSSAAQIKEQIVRVLLERLVVNRPHPWGVLVVFIELIRDSTHGLWSQPFIKIAPEIERLFSSIARSCLNVATNASAGMTATTL